MVKIERHEHNFGYCFDIYTDDGCFQITFMGNLDLYWMCKYNNVDLDNDNEKSFYVGRESCFLYRLIDDLYNDVREYRIFNQSDFDSNNMNELFKAMDYYKEEKLFHDDKIDWHSDDFEYDKASRLVIEKQKNCYKITFHNSKGNIFDNYSVRISNSGSRYSYFNILFMKMYRKMCECDSEFDIEKIDKKGLVKKKEII